MSVEPAGVGGRCCRRPPWREGWEGALAEVPAEGTRRRRLPWLLEGEVGTQG